MDLYDIYTHTIDDEDKCNECDEKRVKECCNKCGEGLCLSVSCCQTFPHHKNDIYIICNACIIDIEQKLRPTTVDTCDLHLLKKKINKRMEANMKNWKTHYETANKSKRERAKMIHKTTTK